MKILCVPRISNSRVGKSISTAVDKSPFLKKIYLPDDSVSSGKTDILIGPDLHWYLCYVSKI